MQFPTYKTIKQELLQKNFISIPNLVHEKEINLAVNKFMEFLKLPQKIKKSFLYRLLSEDRGSEVGYNFRERKLGNADDREYFHYHQNAEQGFAQARKQQPELDALLTAMRPIYTKGIAMGKQIITTFEEEFPGITHAFFRKEEEPKCYLRLVAYNQHEPGDFLAIGHYDRGSCTIALAESKPGLRIGPSPQKEILVAHQPQQALFFPGIRFPEATNPSFIPAWHDVIQKATDAYSSTYARWALVLFIDTHEMTYVTYEQAHTPIMT